MTNDGIATHTMASLPATTQTSMFLELPYSDAVFNSPTKKVNWVGRRAKLSKDEVWKRLNVQPTQQLHQRRPPTDNNNSSQGMNHSNSNGTVIRYCLYSFGGHEFPLAPAWEWVIPEGWVLVLVDRTNTAPTKLKSTTTNVDPITNHNGNDLDGKGGGVDDDNGKGDDKLRRVLVLNQKAMEEQGVAYVDLVNAVDVVVCKTGYGIVAECIMHGLAVLYTDRPGFIGNVATLE